MKRSILPEKLHALQSNAGQSGRPKLEIKLFESVQEDMRRGDAITTLLGLWNSFSRKPGSFDACTSSLMKA
jgi:hypothetical protein